jgi:hypothetical protein
MAPVRGGTAMTQRKGEVTLPHIKRKWPYHVALAADKVRCARNSEIVWSFAQTLSAGPRPYSLRCDDGEFVAFCFARPEDAVRKTKAFDQGENSRRPEGRPLIAAQWTIACYRLRWIRSCLSGTALPPVPPVAASLSAPFASGLRALALIPRQVSHPT